MIFSRLRRAYEALERFGATMFRQMDAVYTRAWQGPLRRLHIRTHDDRGSWPVTPGAYVLGDPEASVAVCTLTSTSLANPVAELPGVAIAGRLFTCNLGIEKIVINVNANRRIRGLLICGMESELFQPGQGLSAMIANGVDRDRRIVGGKGYLPVLSGVSADAVDQFRRQVVFVDRTGVADVAMIRDEVERLVTELGPPPDSAPPPIRASVGDLHSDDSRFTVLRPGGKREPLSYDPKGYIVITLERDEGIIAARHYLPNASPAHVMRGRSGEGMILAMIREGIVTQLSHAAYLGAELQKAEAALRLGLNYEQDQPLKKRDEIGSR